VDSHSPGQRSSSDADRAQLAIDGGRPVRTEPLPAAWPGAWVFGEEEVEAAAEVLRAKSPFRHYGPRTLPGGWAPATPSG